MSSICRTCRFATFLAAALLVGGVANCAHAADAVPVSEVDSAQSVQLDLVDNSVLVEGERVAVLLSQRQWDVAIELLQKLAELPGGKLISVTTRRYVSLAAWCQVQLATLPPAALKHFRARIDPVARRWYQQGISDRNRGLPPSTMFTP
jgi:hypothetical protein